jgi:hypothetical protein
MRKARRHTGNAEYKAGPLFKWLNSRSQRKSLSYDSRGIQILDCSTVGVQLSGEGPLFPWHDIKKYHAAM